MDVIEHAHHDGFVVQSIGDGDGLVSESLATPEGAPVSQLRAQGRQYECSIRTRGDKRGRGRLEYLDLVGIDCTNRAVETAIVGEGSSDQTASVTQLGRESRRTEKSVTIGG